jgi:hypothetical protein
MLDTYRVGHTILTGNSTLSKLTIIDIIEEYNENVSYLLRDDETSKVFKEPKTLDEVDVFVHHKNNINIPETQDVRGRYTIEGDEDQPNHNPKYEIGTKVKFSAELKGAHLEIQGYVIQNFWYNYYLVSEIGVSVPERYWKVRHHLCEKC